MIEPINRNNKIVVYIYIGVILVMLLNSCNYSTIQGAKYPKQTIYLPAAVQGLFKIDKIQRKRGDTPVPGHIFRFKVDTAKKIFTVPLAVYRAGVSNNGSFSVNIKVNQDTLRQLKQKGQIDNNINVLQSNDYEIPSMVTMKNGNELAHFKLEVDLNFLRNNANKVFGMGISISSDKRKTNPEFSTAIILIYPKILKPIADFNYVIDKNDPLSVSFKNNSLYGLNYQWKFGDGNSSEKMNPTHKYTSNGTYTVTLVTSGVTGSEDKSLKKLMVTVTE